MYIQYTYIYELYPHFVTGSSMICFYGILQQAHIDFTIRRFSPMEHLSLNFCRPVAVCNRNTRGKPVAQLRDEFDLLWRVSNL